MTLKPRIFTRRAPWRTVVGPETRRLSLAAMRLAVLVNDRNVIEADYGRCLQIARERFEAEHKVFVAGFACFRSYNPMTTDWSIWLYDVELQDEGTENRSVAELERSIGAAPNRCRKCGAEMKTSKCDTCGWRQSTDGTD